MNVYIYALKDLENVFYIGQCRNIKIRKTSHISGSARKKTEKDKIIQKILNEGRMFEMYVIDECDELQANEKEKYYIALYSKNGFRLTNHVHNTDFKLSKIEKQVLLLLSKDMDTEDIAPLLLKSNRTIETIRQNLKKKFNVKTLTGLIMSGIEKRYIVPNI